jgi:pilus assembly protein CpaF
MIPQHVFEQSLLQFLQPIGPYLEDASVSEIMINSYAEIYVERKGKLYKTDARFSSIEALESAIRNLAQFVGKHVDAERPILEARLPDGSRVEAILPPAAPDGPCLAIRRFSKERLTIDKLVDFGALTPRSAQWLNAFVAAKLNILVAGGTGSGKTSLLNALSSFIPEDERIVIIEDSRELQLQQPHVVQLEARPPDAKGRGEVTIRDLFRATLRMRPDRVVVGEIRGGEALELIQAMTSGHGGCLSTIHATYPRDTLSRLETLALLSDIGLPLAALRAQIASAINLIVQTARLSDGSRGITHISEVTGYDNQKGYLISDLFVRKTIKKQKDGKIISELAFTGHQPSCAPALEALGFDLDDKVSETPSRRP